MFEAASYDYPGIGGIPGHFSGESKRRQKRSPVGNGSHIASPLNPYVGLECAAYEYDLWKGEYVATGANTCVRPEKLTASVNNLNIIATYKNYFICDGNNDCYERDDEAIELCGKF